MAYKQHDIFQLIWKSQYSVSKETVDIVLKELNDEIRYQSTMVLPRAKSTVSKNNVLKTLESLRKQRDSLLMKYDDQRMPRASGGLGGDPQSTDQNYETDAKKSFQKSITKKDILKALYARAWGSMTGLNEDTLHKMNDQELDEQIRALEVLFD